MRRKARKNKEMRSGVCRRQRNERRKEEEMVHRRLSSDIDTQWCKYVSYSVRTCHEDRKLHRDSAERLSPSLRDEYLWES